MKTRKPDFECIIPMRPMPNKSVQFVRPTKGRPMVGAYKPKELREYQDEVMTHIIVSGGHTVRGPVLVMTDYIFELPACHHKKRNPRTERSWHFVRPDYDNLDKAINDAIKQRIFEDDSYICVKLTRKRYGSQGEKAKIIIKVWQITGGTTVVFPCDETDAETVKDGQDALCIRLEDIQGVPGTTPAGESTPIEGELIHGLSDYK